MSSEENYLNYRHTRRNCCFVTRTVFVSHLLAFCLNKDKRGFPKRSPFFIEKRANEVQIRNCERRSINKQKCQDEISTRIKQFKKSSQFNIQASGIHIERRKNTFFRPER